VKIWEIESPM